MAAHNIEIPSYQYIRRKNKTKQNFALLPVPCAAKREKKIPNTYFSRAVITAGSPLLHEPHTIIMFSPPTIKFLPSEVGIRLKKESHLF